MRVDVLSRHLPSEQGSAAGRVLLATCEGLRAEGVEVAVTSWAPEEPADLPAWCTWFPLPPEAGWRTRGRAVLRPRTDVRRLGWQPEGVAVADDPLSAPAVPAGGWATLHYVTALDLAALRPEAGRPRPRDLQDLRAERALRTRFLGRVLTYSARTAAWSGGTAVPVAFPVPPEPVPLVDAPVAALVADWRWPPNRVALLRLLRDWPRVRAAVAGASLLLAGRGDPGVASHLDSGVEVLGPVSRSDDVLSRAAVLAFPCPDTSGPKIKVLEAAALGLCVVTTAAGAEGVSSDALVVAAPEAFAGALVDVLLEPARRAGLAARARADVLAVHAPRPAARARKAVLEAAQGP